MTLPPFAPFPPASLRKEIIPEEWEACMEAWILLAQGSLLLPPNLFSLKLTKDPSLSEFLVSYMRESSSPNALDNTTAKARALRRECFLLVHRSLAEVNPAPQPLLDWEFLGDLSIVYSRTKNLRPLLIGLWNQANLGKRPQMQDSKRRLMNMLEDDSKDSLDRDQCLHRAGALLKASHDYGRFLMTGSDVLDSLVLARNQSRTDLRKKVVTITYLALSGLLEGESPNISLLLDHLYGLKATVEKQNSAKPNSSLLSQLASMTPLVRKLEDGIKGSDAARAKTIISYLSEVKNTNGTNPKKHVRRKIDKGKGKGRSNEEYGHGAMGNVHVHKMSLVTQIQDLFPDLGSGFIVKLLDEYNDDPEEVTAHLLEDSLPTHLQKADQTENINHILNYQSNDLVPNLAPRSTPPLLPSRRNVFDNDDFDNLAIPLSNLHFGHRKTPDPLTDRSNAPNKAAILSALALFDSDDDERDDTYDVEDVGGTVDSAIPGSDEVDADLRDKNEEALFGAYRMTPEVFERDSNTRRGKARLALKSETGMTDEALEGWAIMIGRDPRRLRRLEAKFSTFSGGQRELASTAYREGGPESGTEDSEGGGRGGRGGTGGRGRGRGAGRGGNVAGPADDRGVQVARQRKDASKGSRANHNRRDQRARKVARAGFMG